MEKNMPPVEANAEIDDTIDTFGDTPFFSKEFIDEFRKKYPEKWMALISQYGIGGRNSGNRYSSSGFIGRQLDHRANQQKLLKLPRREAPPGWGNDWIVVWQSIKAAGTPHLFPDEIKRDTQHIEGHSKKVLVNKYERDIIARKKCIEYYKCVCCVCQMDFGIRYGAHGLDFIHVHHLKPLSTIGKSHIVDPIADLRPVCPNCHAMIHYRGGLLSIEKLKEILHTSRPKNSDE